MTDEQCGAVPSLPWFVKPVPVCELAPNHEGCHRQGKTLWGFPLGAEESPRSPYAGWSSEDPPAVRSGNVEREVSGLLWWWDTAPPGVRERLCAEHPGLVGALIRVANAALVEGLER